MNQTYISTDQMLKKETSFHSILDPLTRLIKTYHIILLLNYIMSRYLIELNILLFNVLIHNGNQRNLKRIKLIY